MRTIDRDPIAAPTQEEIEAFCGRCDKKKACGGKAANPFYREIGVTRLSSLALLRSQQSRSGIAYMTDKDIEFGEDDGARILVGMTDQQRYVVRRWCGWAEVDGQRGDMTPGGFEPK